MHSFIFNSNCTPWWKAGLLAAAVWLCCVLSYERYLRELGHRPTVVDSQQLWSQERQRANSSSAIVFAGASRTLYGIDLGTVSKIFPGATPVMLALNGRYPIATLEHLAHDPEFRGTLLLDVDARGLAQHNWGAQLPANRYFAEEWTPNWAAHRRVLSLLQDDFAAFNPRLGLLNIIKHWLGASRSPFIAHDSLNSAREGSLNFELVNAMALANSFKDGLEQDLKSHPPLPADEWLESLAPVKNWVAAIERRGGRVIFYVPPVSGHQLELAMSAYPVRAYWQRFIQHYELDGWHFTQDVNIQRIRLPDDSHVSAHMKSEYTATLLTALSNANLL